MTMRDMEKVKVWIPICIDPLGHLCEQALYDDVETVYKYVHNLWPTNIFIYGESSMDLSTVSKNQLVGSSPSCYIAANHPEGIVGLILHSALLSGIKSKKSKRSTLGVRLFTSNPLFRPCDPFDNYRIISKITVRAINLLDFILRFLFFKSMQLMI